jgi:hypothetical protein
MAAPNRTYVADGRVLEKSVDHLRDCLIYPDADLGYSPPLSARFSRGIDNIYNFFGLYFVSLFSVCAMPPSQNWACLSRSLTLLHTQLDPYAAAENSQFNTRNRPNSYQTRPRWTSSNTQRGTGPAGSGSSGRPGPRRPMGTVDDVRGPECSSCG